MNLVAMVVLAPVLALLASDLRQVRIALVATWAVILAPQTHLILVDQQADEQSYGNTISYFVINYLILAGGMGLATLIHRRRFGGHAGGTLELPRS